MDPGERPLDVKVTARPLPAPAAQLRLHGAVDNARNDPVAGPRITAVLTACKLVGQQLEGLHQRYANNTDLDLIGYSRAAALWLLSGRILGLLRALLVQVEAGICNESVITGRAIHEAARILFAFSVPGEETLVRLWLDDEGRYGYVKQGPARAAIERYENALAEAMTRSGLPAIPGTREKTEEVYDRQSRVAHSRRSSCVDSVWDPARVMAYGYQPSTIRRAGYARWAASMTGEVINAVGDALRALYGQPGFFTERIAPMHKQLEAVLASSPLDETSIRAAASAA
jgi:hypothetical protein